MKFKILTLISALLLSACSLIEERGMDCPYPGDGDDDITISFSMMASDPLIGSRADDQNHDEVGSELRSFEEGIDMNDCAIFIFAKKEGSVGDETLLYKKPNFGVSQDVENSIYGAPGLYTVNMVFAKSQLNDLLDFELNPNSEEKIAFRILVLANCSSPGTNALAKWNEINATTYDGVIAQLNGWTYAMSYLYKKDYTGSDAAGIYANTKKNAPMFGTLQASVTQEALYYSRTDNRVYMGEMDLLRAIAKVRVIDNIQNKDAEGYPKIIGAEFIGSQSMARQLPSDAIDYQNGNQVHDPNIAQPDNELNLNGNDGSTFRLGTIPDAWSITDPDERKGSTWIGFVPEQKIGHVNNDVNQGMPIFRITVEFYDHSTKDYDVNMKSFNGQTFDFGDNILRNHIYTLSVNEVKDLGAELKLTFEIKSWTEEKLTLDYTAIPNVTQKEFWTPGSYESYDPNTGVVIVKPASTVESIVPVKGYFVLDTPAGATWHAFLIPSSGNGNPYAFQFKDKDNYVSSLSGTVVPGKEIEIEIYPRIVEPEENNEALLQIVVTLGNGNVIEVPVTPDGKNYKNFTILQNKQ